MCIKMVSLPPSLFHLRLLVLQLAQLSHQQEQSIQQVVLAEEPVNTSVPQVIAVRNTAIVEQHQTIVV